VPERNEAIVLAAIALFVVAVDQLTKAAVTAGLGPGSATSRLDILNERVALEYAENRGVAFGLFAGFGPLLIVAASAVLVVVIAQFRRAGNPTVWQTVAIGLIAGGAVGNLLDRIRLGYVVDFVAVGPWPNFNVADSAVTVGVVMLLFMWARSGIATDVERAR
jgi:signal peptidase II